MADPRKSILLRINPGLWEDLARWASDDLRSINGQIEFILREAVRKRTNRSHPAENGAEEGTSSTASETPDEPPRG